MPHTSRPWPPPTRAEIEVTDLHPVGRTRSENIWAVPSICAKDSSNQVGLMGKIFEILQKDPAGSNPSSSHKAPLQPNVPMKEQL